MGNFLGILNLSDRVHVESLSQRLTKSKVLSSNIANAETPGYRSLGYDFEDQLQSIVDASKKENLKTTKHSHFIHEFANQNLELKPDVFVVPTESIPEDGNTVDMEREMSELSKNQILYRTSIEALNRKLGVLKYAINGGR